MLKITLSTIAAITIALSGLNAKISQQKDIHVVLADTNEVVVVQPSHYTPPAPATNGYDDTITYARASKKSYHAYEPITIQLKLKRDAYIYFWTVSHDGNGYLILPNNFESFNTYKASTEYVVPEKSARYHFVSDRAGVEQVYVLATDKKIAKHKIEAIFNEKVSGVIPKATSKSIKNFITKDIKVIAKEQDLKFDMVSFKIDVKTKYR